MERNTWVDYAKGLGIILVVYGHVARGLFEAGIPFDRQIYQLADSMVYSFHMPLFFFLSGLFFYQSLLKRGRLALLANKLDTIFYPYLIWSILQGVIQAFLSNFTNEKIHLTEVFALLWHPRAQFWFLYALFFVTVLCVFMYGKLKPRHFLPAVFFFFCVHVFENLLPGGIPLNYIYHNTIFFVLGIWFDTVKDAVFARRKTFVVPLLALFAGGQFVFHIVMGRNYTAAGLPTLALAVVSVFAVIVFCMCLAEAALKWLLFLGTSSMTIYLMHVLAGSGIRIILQKFLHTNSLPVHLLIGVLAGMGLPLLAQKLIATWNLQFLLQAPVRFSASFAYNKWRKKSAV